MRNRADDYMRRTEKLWEIAEEDEICCIWNSEYKQFKKKLERIERFLPKGLVRTVYGYADYRAMMLQRVISLACMCMEFTGEKPIEWKEKKNENVIRFIPEREE